MILALLLVITGSAVSASAEEFDNTTGWLNLFDYSSIKNHNFTSPAGGTRQYTFNLPSAMRLFDIDIVLFVTGGIPDVSVLKPDGSTVLLNQAKLTNNMVRYYGYIYSPNYRTVDLLIGSSNAHSGSIISASACTVVSTFYSTSGSMRLQSLNYNNPIDQTVSMSNSSNSAHIATSNVDFNSYILEFFSPYWTRYDTLDFVVSLDGVSVDSISAEHNGMAIDVDYELVNSLYDSYLNIVFRLDLTGLDRESTVLPKIIVTGQTEDAVGFSLVSVRGCLLYDVPDPYVFWLSQIHDLLTDQLTDIVGFLTSIDKTLTTLSSSLVSKLTTLNTTITTMNSNLASKLTTLNASITSMNTNLAGKLTTLNTSITSMNTNLAGKLTTLNTSITTMNSNIADKLTTLNTSITSMNSNLGTKLSTINTTLTTKFDSTISTINAQFNNLKGWLSSGFKSVTDKLDVLINGTQEQQDAADQYKDNAADQSGQIDAALGNMNVAKPPAEDIDVSVNSMTGGLNFSPFNTAILTLSSSGIVYRLLVIAVTLMMVSYVFFGKKV